MSFSAPVLSSSSTGMFGSPITACERSPFLRAAIALTRKLQWYLRPEMLLYVTQSLAHKYRPDCAMPYARHADS